jgi:glycerol-3-phosphate O-acyltransferase/dihydroxyacetone phosphate acyltransferase
MQRRRFRSRVLLQFGAPVMVDAARAGDANVVAEVTAELDRGLRALTVNAADWETLRVLDGFRRLYQPPQISIHDRVELARRFNAEYPRVCDEPEVKALYARVSAYLDRLDAAGVTDRDLLRTLSRGDALVRIARHLLLIVVWLPLALPGAILHAPAGFMVQLAAPVLTPRKDVLAATKLLAGLLMVLASYAVGIGWLAFRVSVGAALLALIALPITGYATLRVFDRGTSLRRGFSTLVRLLSFDREIQALRAERAALEAAVIAAVNRFRPADMVLLFPREAEPA